MNALTSYFKDSLNELKLVTWPKQEELLRLTITTVVFVLIASVILGAADYLLSQGYQWLLTLSDTLAQ